MDSEQVDSPERKPHILQIVGDPVGGIRKHVHIILAGMSNSFIFSYAYSIVNTDAKFKEEVFQIKNKIQGRMIPLTVRKKPDLTDLINIWRLKSYIKAQGVTIVHGHGAKGGLYARLLGKLCGIKSIYTPHGGAVHRMFSPMADWVYTLVEKSLLKLTDYFVFESEYSANAYSEKVGKKPERSLVNYNGLPDVNLDEIRMKASLLNNRTQDVNMIHMGIFAMLRPEKGQTVAIKAVHELIHRGYHVKLHLFGDGPGKQDLIALTQKLQLTQHIIFDGEVSPAEPYMYLMDLILIPSLFESFGYVALEAYSLKKPVIASKTGGLTEIIIDGETGRLVKPGDSTALADAIVEYLNNQTMYKEYANNGYKRLKQIFCEEVMLHKLASIYKNI